jgi:hypothetical protein
MRSSNTEEVFRVAGSKELAETGGGHNQKGVDFPIKGVSIGFISEMKTNAMLTPLIRFRGRLSLNVMPLELCQ